MSTQPAEKWTSDQAYEPYVGHWSRLVAPRFLAWLASPPGLAWCDVGCGTGALAHAVLDAAEPARVLGVDPSEEYLAAARRGTDARFTGRAGSATAIPAADGEFDRVVSGLMLNFVPDPGPALAELRRVTRADGWVGGYVWDYAEGMELIRRFWDAAIAEDPADGPGHPTQLDEARRFPLCAPAPLHELFDAAGLREVAGTELTVHAVFADPDAVWRPFLGGQGPAPGYLMGLPAEHRNRVRERFVADLPAQPDGTVALAARAWAVRGRVPAV